MEKNAATKPLFANFFDDKHQLRRAIRREFNGGKVLEIAAGRAEYRKLFDDYLAIDLPNNPYLEEGKVDVYCDARFLALEKQRFDFAFIVSALYLIPQPEKAMRQVFEALKPTAKFIVFDYTQRTLVQAVERNRKVGRSPTISTWDSAGLKQSLKAVGFAKVEQFYLRGRLYDLGKRLLRKDTRWTIFRATK